MPPRITPFNFGDDIQEGMRVQVMCTSAQGDQPFNITWYRDAKALRAGEQIDSISSSYSGINSNHARQKQQQQSRQYHIFDEHQEQWMRYAMCTYKMMRLSYRLLQ